MDKIEFLKELIKQDEPSINFLSAEYTHSKNIEEINCEEKHLVALELSKTIITWLTVTQSNGFQREYKNPVIQYEAGVIRYRPDIIHAYISNHSK